MNPYKIIQTKYIGPTNHRGSRVSAKDDNGNRVTIHWLSELNIEQNHSNAAQQLLNYIASKNNDSALQLVGYGSLDKGYVLQLKGKGCNHD